MPDERDLERELQQAKKELEELRRSEEALRKDKERFRTLFDVLPVGVSILDRERRVVATNDALDTILRLPKAGVLAGEYARRSYIRADGTPMPADEFPSAQALTEKRPIHNVEIGIVLEDGETIWTSVSATPLPVEDLAVAVTTVDITARKRAEQEAQRLLAELERERESAQALAEMLERERDTLQTIMENTRAQLAYLDAGMNFVRVNTAYAAGSGHTCEEMIGRNHFDLFPHAENQAIFEKVRDSGRPIAFQAKPFEFVDQPERGVTYWDWTLTPVRETGQGRVQGLVLSLLDVTESVRAAQERERLLRENGAQRAFVQAVVHDAPAGIVVLDGRELRVKLSNPAYLLFLDEPYCSSGIDGLPLHEFIPRAEESGVLDMFRRVAASGQPHVEAEYEHVGFQRGTTYWRWSLQPLEPAQAPGQDWPDLLLLVTEVTESVLARRQVEEMARRTAQHAAELEATITAIPNGLILYGPDGEILRMNATAERLLGYSAHDRSRPLVERLAQPRAGLNLEPGDAQDADEPPADHHAALPLLRALRGETVPDSVVTMRNAETGRQAWLVGSTAPIRLPDGSVGGAISLFADITAIRETEQRLQEANRRLEEQAEELQVQNAELLALAQQLESERARLQAVLQQMPGAVLIAAAPSGRVILANRQMQELLGDPATRSGRTDQANGFIQLPAFHPDGRPYPPTERPLARALSRAESMQDIEIHFTRADGSSRVVLASAAPIVDHDGSVSAAVATFVDITERQAMAEAVRRARDELELRVQERTAELREAYAVLEHRVADRTRELSTLLTISERLASTLEIEPLLGLILDQLAGIVDYRELVIYELVEESPAGSRPRAGAREMRVLDYRGPLVRDEARAIRFSPVKGLGLDRTIRQRTPLIVSDLQGRGADERAWRTRATPAERKLLAHSRSLLSVPLVVKDRVIGLLQIGHEEPDRFTQREANLAQALASHAAVALENAQLYQKARELAAMEERQRLARELHDAVSQTLFSASLIADVLPRLWKQSPEAGLESAQDLGKLTRAALAEMRLLLWELRPAAMLEADPGQLLQQLAEAISGKGHLNIEVLVKDSCPLPPDVQVALYRIAQEALNNIVKHAAATSATICFKCVPTNTGQARSAELTILDNGRGFNPQVATPGRLGLGIMRERAHAIGASLRVDSRPGEGTQIAVVWPGC